MSKEELTLANYRKGKTMQLARVEDRGYKNYFECKVYLEFIQDEQVVLLIQKIEDSIPLTDCILGMNELFGVSLRLRIPDEFMSNIEAIGGRTTFWNKDRVEEKITQLVEEVRKEIPDE